MQDLHDNIKVEPSINPAAIINANGTTTGATHDRLDFDSVEYAVQTGVVTDGQWVIQLWAGDASNMSDEAQVTASAEILGTIPTIVATDDTVVKRFGYRGAKRYSRIKAVQSGATTGGFIAATCIKGHARVAPVA